MRSPARNRRQPGLLPRDAAPPVRNDRGEYRQGRTVRAGGRQLRPCGHRETVRLGRDERPGSLRRPLHGVRGGADLSHRPLPREGDSAEPARAAVRQLPSSSRSGTGHGSTTCRSPLPRRSGSASGAASTSPPGRCATSFRTTSCKCSHCSSWSRPPPSTRRRSATRRSSCCGPSGRWTRRWRSPPAPYAGSTRVAATREDLMPGYRDEPGVDPLSSTETFVAMRLQVQNWRWTGVPHLRAHRQAAPDPAHRGRHGVSPPPATAAVPWHGRGVGTRRLDRAGPARTRA